MFYKTYTVERFNTDTKDELTPSSLFHLLNDIMERNAESYGMGADYHIQRDLAWVLIEYQVNITRLPKSDEVIKVGTIPYSFKRFYGFRKYEIIDEKGNTIVKGKGKFTLINLKTKKFVKPSEAMLKKFSDALPYPETLPFDKWSVDTKQLLVEKKRIVSSAHIDVNNHLNNAFYPLYAYEALDKAMIDTLDPEKIYVKFKKEVFASDVLNIQVFQGDSGIFVQLKKEEEIMSEVYIQQKNSKV